MSTHQYIEPLVESDFSGFASCKSVARIFSQKTGWYIGICRKIRFDTSNPDLCLIRLEPFASFEPALSTTDPQDPGQVIFSPTDQVKGNIRVNELPFRLLNPQRIIDANQNSPILIIRGEEEDANKIKIAIISKRLQDITAVEKFERFAQYLAP